MMIETRNLTKKFNGVIAVKSLDLGVQKGEIFGLLGPNGAGKTTTISMLSTVLTPTSGSAEVAGHDIIDERDAVRESIGIVFQDPSLDEELTGYENLDFHARLYGMPAEKRRERIFEVLRLVDLMEKRDIRVKSYSGGMKRRLEIARGLMHRPDVLFLDEPTLGLDPQTRRHIWDYIKGMNETDGVTILLTTHYMEEADFLCERVAIIDHGEIIALDKPSRLKSKIGENVVSVEVSNAEEFCKVIRKEKMKCVIKAKGVDGKVHLTVKDGERAIPEIIKVAERSGLNVESVSMHSPTLEDVFIQLTGRRLREERADKGDGFRQRVAARRRRR
jgi:ABC-2 type transport system ATP-binding protein